MQIRLNFLNKVSILTLKKEYLFMIYMNLAVITTLKIIIKMHKIYFNIKKTKKMNIVLQNNKL